MNKTIKILAVSGLSIASSFFSITPFASAYTYTPIADTIGKFAYLTGTPIRINDNGTVAFRAIWDDTRFQGIYTGNGSILTTIAETSYPDAPNSTAFYAPSINNSGQVAFNGYIAGSNGCYRF